MLLEQSHGEPAARRVSASVHTFFYGQDTRVVWRLNLENLDKPLTGIHYGT